MYSLEALITNAKKNQMKQNFVWHLLYVYIKGTNQNGTHFQNNTNLKFYTKKLQQTMSNIKYDLKQDQ